MTEIQKITLRDVLRQEGLSERRIEDVFLLLRYKPEHVQLVFYYAAQGWTQTDVALLLGTSQRTVHYHLNVTLFEVRTYLKENALS